MSRPPTQTKIKNYLGKLEECFLPYQTRLMADQSELVVIPKSVRTGITYAHSYKMAKKRAFRHPEHKTTTEIFIGKNEKTAQEYLGYHRKWADAFCKLMGEGFIDFSRWTSVRAVYPGGNIEIYSSNPDSFRGVEGDVTIDEMAFHDRQREVLSAAVSRGQFLHDRQVTCISSHATASTLFAQIAQGRERNDPSFADWSLHKITLPAAVDDGLAELVPGKHHQFYDGTRAGAMKARQAFLDWARRRYISDEDYQRECLCEPARLGQLVVAAEYDKCVLKDKEGMPREIPTGLAANAMYGDLYVGIDIGGGRDMTVKAVLDRREIDGESFYRLVAFDKIRTKDYTQQLSWLKPEATHDMVQFGMIDQGAVGSQLANDIAYENPRVKPIGFNRANQALMAERLRAFVQGERISLPPDSESRAAFLSMRREITEQNTVKYVGGTRHSHADEFWAMALALHAAEHQQPFGMSVAEIPQAA
jgi:phage FluMu gp28-like protein